MASLERIISSLASVTGPEFSGCFKAEATVSMEVEDQEHTWDVLKKQAVTGFQDRNKSLKDRLACLEGLVRKFDPLQKWIELEDAGPFNSVFQKVGKRKAAKSYVNSGFRQLLSCYKNCHGRDVDAMAATYAGKSISLTLCKLKCVCKQ